MQHINIHTDYTFLNYFEFRNRRKIQKKKFKHNQFNQYISREKEKSNDFQHAYIDNLLKDLN